LAAGGLDAASTADGGRSAPLHCYPCDAIQTDSPPGRPKRAMPRTASRTDWLRRPAPTGVRRANPLASGSQRASPAQHRLPRRRPTEKQAATPRPGPTEAPLLGRSAAHFSRTQSLPSGIAPSEGAIRAAREPPPARRNERRRVGAKRQRSRRHSLQDEGFFPEHSLGLDNGSALTCAAQRPPSTGRSRPYAARRQPATMRRRWAASGAAPCWAWAYSACPTTKRPRLNGFSGLTSRP